MASRQRPGTRSGAQQGRILIAAIGRARADPAAALYRHYAERVTLWQLELMEIELRQKLPPARLKAEETARLLAAMPEGAAIVALDESGEQATSRALATRLAEWRDASRPVGFLIGGADGLDQAARTRADWRLAFGRVTWPHLLVRGLLAEQLYRAQQILASHPYHRD
ncbi:MAG: 23S rRNA (pseudouridine(1915)-N(3))-methyltransferase RlmH [Alphaproteobacteria bacterium]|nr:23S rRNA (pseudouridine(1915)-N(3))-methyltransferase RlmH [Alphaproteobacteria bacterium]